MQDEMIVWMYWNREEKAIEETAAKYGSMLFRLAYNVLADTEDSKESLNDAYLKVWTSIPPHRPLYLAPYLSRTVRQTSIDIFRRKNRKKRADSQYSISLAELADCVSRGDETQMAFDSRILSNAINKWLKTLKTEERVMFIGRYYFMDSIKDISSYYGFSQSKVKSILFRLRGSLKRYLEEEGFDL